MKYAPLFSFIALCTVLAIALMTPKQSAPSSPLLGKPFPTLTLDGQQIHSLMNGRVMMINLFASWCVPCTVEQPVLMKIQERNILPIIGIAWKNKPQDAEIMLAKRGNPYATLLHDEQGASTIALALTGVPESFIVDKKGMVRFYTREPINDDMVEQTIIPLVKQLEAE